MCKCGLKAQWSTQPRASVATPWVPPVLEQSRPERAKALLCALDFYQSNKHKAQAQNSSSNGGDASRVGKIKAKAHR